MEKSTKGEIAENYFKQGYNCCQAVILAFAEETGLNKSDLLKAASSFGGGIGRLREVCGTVSAMAMAAGLIFGTDELSQEKKAAHYELIQKLAGEFKEKNGSIICRELLGLPESEKITSVPEPRTEQYYVKRPCSFYCKTAAEILEKYISENKKR